MASDILIIPNKGSTSLNPAILFSGSAANTIRLETLQSGSVAFLGTSGSLFSIVDSMVGSLMAVSDISGLPILEVFNDDRVVMGKFNSNALVVTASNVGLGMSTPTQRLEVSGNIKLTVGGTIYGDGSNAYLSMTNSNGSKLAYGSVYFEALAASINIQATSEPVTIRNNNGSIKLDGNGNTFITGSVYCTGSIIDYYGMNVRSVPQNSQSGTYTLVASDNGKHIYTNSSITVPVNVFNVGDVVTVVNNSNSSISILQGSATLRQAGTSNTGNRTLALYGICSIMCVASNTYYITGTGLT